ncbi:xylose isomerase [Lachnospiraceae bacterium]|uniref:sugar phosphate isomerase/epimerase family protein n=1 Tax=Extibacter sp. GGCC_0201 TaxID=2731209 RepID=UPI001AA1B15C|nr:TIM barrel protein [Extibacter sp. GGCC_0201]MBO1722219.1 TIM barrel protein [Extibacter sp. GGCC_0201]BDF35364.1 xylose isomerase [Lachnospiraceae bacterium]BDF39366.1 xylose isomerase [Lachnospiraceae bacterium]
MKLGLNLSFAVKRFLEPEKLAHMCRHEFGTDHVQFTWDLIDPWWPEELRDVLAIRYKEAFEEESVHIDATFGGLASYSYAHLLAPAKEQREAAFLFFKRAIDLTAVMGAKVMGTPVGGMSYDDARCPARREERYEEMLGYVRRLASYGKEKGLEEIHIEATPLITEFPYSPEVSVKMMKDLEGTDIPVKLLVDWGHALYEPLLKEEADIELWFHTCAPYIGSIHLQQTDGQWDRHWDFTKKGIVTPELIRRATAGAGLDDVMQYLEVVTIFEDDDDAVYDGMKKTMDYLHRELD